MDSCGQLLCSTSPSSYNPEYLATTVVVLAILSIIFQKALYHTSIVLFVAASKLFWLITVRPYAALSIFS